MSVDVAADAAARSAVARLGRRDLVRAVGLLAVAGVIPSGCGGAPAALAPPTDATLRALSPRGYATFTAAAMRVVGDAGGALIADRRVDVGLACDAWLARTPALAAPFAQALALLEFAPWPLLAKVRPFTALDPAAQDGVLADCMTSRLETKRAVFRGIRSLALLTFYAAPATRPLTGYPGPFGNESVTIADAMRD